jgi:nucleotide-binding universal stress UspA family protein
LPCFLALGQKPDAGGLLVASSATWPMQRFVLAFDGGPSALKAVDYAVEQPLLKGMSCHLLCVGKTGLKHETALREAESKLSAAGYEVHAELLAGDPDAVITKAISQENADLLVMGAYGHSRIR